MTSEMTDALKLLADTNPDVTEIANHNQPCPAAGIMALDLLETLGLRQQQLPLQGFLARSARS